MKEQLDRDYDRLEKEITEGRSKNGLLEGKYNEEKELEEIKEEKWKNKWIVLDILEITEEKYKKMVWVKMKSYKIKKKCNNCLY